VDSPTALGKEAIYVAFLEASFSNGGTPEGFWKYMVKLLGL